MLIMRDYECTRCNKQFEALLRNEDKIQPSCEACGSNDAVHKIVSGYSIFNTIVPTGVGTKKLKAGFEHNFRDRPAEKIQVGYGAKYKG